jgi:hypothetical protein
MAHEGSSIRSHGLSNRISENSTTCGQPKPRPIRATQINSTRHFVNIRLETSFEYS